MRGNAVRIGVVALVGVAAFAASAAARTNRTHQRAHKSCPAAHTHLLAADAQAVIYQPLPSARPYPYNAYLYACAYRTRHVFRLGLAPVGGPSGSAGVGPIALAGPVVAYGAGETYTGPPYSSREEVWVRNLSTGKVIHRVPNGSPPEPGNVGLGGTTAIVVKRDGSVAWMAGANEQLGHVQVRSVDKTGSHLLAASPEIDFHSLALAGSTLYWTQGGQPFSAQLR